MSGRDEPRPATYRDAGVDLDAAEVLVDRLRPHAERTSRAEVVGSLGGFASLFALNTKRWKEPVLVSATDGVGTKIELARELGRYDTVGIDLVAMVVDDLVCCGAEPLFFLDYLAVDRLGPDAVEQVVAGIADGCAAAGCALVGGETAEHPGLLGEGRFDLAGFGVGIVERERLLGPERVAAGDALVAMASSGLHANGYSLARQLVVGRDLAEDHGLMVQTLGDALLRPTRIYAQDCLALAAQTNVRVFCHVTGGGIPGNLPRVLPAGLGAAVDTSTFQVPRVFRLLQRWGEVAEAEMWRVFNMGIGMLAVVEDGRDAVNVLRRREVDAWVCGAVDDSGEFRLTGM